jgi:RimJ/RimL family protein N-acetyltransferase
MDGNEMHRRFYREGPRSNRDIFKRIKFLDASEMQDEQHIVCHTSSDKVIGDLAFQQSQWDQNIIWMKHISVDEAYQNQGIATELLRYAFEYVESKNKIFEFSSFTDEGKQHLKRVIQRLRDEYPSLELKVSNRFDDDMFITNPHP